MLAELEDSCAEILPEDDPRQCRKEDQQPGRGGSPAPPKREEPYGVAAEGFARQQNLKDMYSSEGTSKKTKGRDGNVPGPSMDSHNTQNDKWGATATDGTQRNTNGTRAEEELQATTDAGQNIRTLRINKLQAEFAVEARQFFRAAIETRRTSQKYFTDPGSSY